MEKHKCFCCGHKTLDERAAYDICPVCFWEDEAYLQIMDNHTFTTLYSGDRNPTQEELLDISSGANHGLTLREARENYSKFGACIESEVQYVRKPTEHEKYPREQR